MDGNPLEAGHSIKCQLAAEVLRASGSLRLRVTGSSMLPSIWPGDVLVIQRREIGQVRPGDTAFFSSHGRLVAHRVISHQRTFLVTQGDSIPQADPAVSESALLGTVTEIIRRGKRVSLSPSLGLAGKITAAVMRRSSRASKIVQRVYALRWQAFPNLSFPRPEQS